jgi:uncharacterized protein with von Willebrand factor type A (vWA) domain
MSSQVPGFDATSRIRDERAVSDDVVMANLLRFGRRLRAAGMGIGSGQILGFLEALSSVDVSRRDDVHAAARATLVTRPEQRNLFDSEFRRFWRDLIEQMPMLLEEYASVDDTSLATPRPNDSNQQKGKGEESEDGKEAERTVLAVEGVDQVGDLGQTEDYEVPPEDVLIFSSKEALRKKDFSHLSPEELAEAKRFIESLDWKLGTRRTRRRERAVRGDFIDYRATMRSALKHGGIPLELRQRKRKIKDRPLVLICDISGSMDRYARLLLRFVHALEHGLDSVEVFVFSTRLTRITRELRRRDVDTAIADVANSVDDWSGGTRIGEAIREFNVSWSRRVLRSGATVIVISDGWDRGDPVQLGQEMAKLQRSCRRLIWLNPLLGAPGYQPLTQGIRAALPYVDYFLPIHNLQSMESLARLLSAMDDQPPVRRQNVAVSERLARLGKA